ncbi:hypothetical protein ACJMK2_038913 [Sinanodonta woodiana]|uniref:Secreted protein n=1 Tax=Sinanodonta woodiana TaxID=1069815 RepID=A0ABD3WBV0_SINWO
MKYSIIFFVVVGLLGNCLLTKFIQGAHTFTGSQALPLERNVCGSPFECLALALVVVLLFENIHGQRNIRPTTTARIKPTTPRTLAQRTTTPASGDLLIVLHSCLYYAFSCAHITHSQPPQHLFNFLSLEVKLEKTKIRFNTQHSYFLRI